MTVPAVRTDRVGLLIDQLTDGVELSRLRLDGVTDDELTWEPYPAMWSIRARGTAITPDAYGPGDHVLDHDSSAHPFAAATLSTAAWRIGHLAAAFAGRWEWTFGARRTPPDQLVEFTPTTAMLERLWTEIDRWARDVEQLGDADLDRIGFGQYPWGIDADIAFIGIVRWMNREAIHHLAEIALLRDLYAAAHR